MSILSQDRWYCNWCIWARGKQCLSQKEHKPEGDRYNLGRLEESTRASKGGIQMPVGVQDDLNIEQAGQPQQHHILPMLHKMMQQRKSTEIELAMAGYFDACDEASEVCRQLLKNVMNIQSNYQSMDSFLAGILDCTTTSSSTGCTTAPSGTHHAVKTFPVRSNPFSTTTRSSSPSGTHHAVKTFPVRSNPFSTTTRSSLRHIHDKYSSILQIIKSSHKNVARKLKIEKTIKLSTTCFIMACGAAAAVAISIAATHLMFFSLLVGTVVMGLCPVALKRRIVRMKCSKAKSLQQLQKQLDTAAKGTYVLGRDFETVSHLVARLSEGIERENVMARYCKEMADEMFPVQEIVKELRTSCSTSRRLAKELEEHVGLCLATIHRARDLVIKELSTQE